jgi:hypothetical protein
MQSPTEVVMKLLHEGLVNNMQIHLMAQTLGCLRPVLSVCGSAEMTAEYGDDGMPIVTSLLNSAMKKVSSDKEKLFFPLLVGVIFLCYCLHAN